MWTNTRYFAKGATAIDYIFFPGTNIRENRGNTGPCVPESSTRSPDEEKVFATSNGHDTMEKEEERKREKKAGTTKIIVLVDRTRRIPCTMECNSVITR